MGKEPNGEYRIDKVTLFSPQKFLKLRRYNFVYTQWRKKAAQCSALTSSDAIAVVTAGGNPETVRRYAHNLIKEELNILSSSRLGFKRRDHGSVVGILGCMDSYDIEDLLLGQSVDLIQSSTGRYAQGQLRITDEIQNLPDRLFPYRRLLKLIRDGKDIDNKWQLILRNVAALAGKSQNAIENADAFLWNMIAIEQLLLGENEPGHLGKLLVRCKALFGYCPLWDRLRLGDAIEKIYNARCTLVHEGNRVAITIEHLIISDLILFNVIGALIFNYRKINSKSRLLEFAEKARARNLLGMNARENGWHWFFSNLRYPEKALREFWSL